MRDDPYWLDKIMEPGHVIRVLPGGAIEELVNGVHAPELVMGCLDDDAGSILAEHEQAYIEAAGAQDWEVLSGWSGQDRYRGACMHPSEFIGGALADHVLETPGLWVAVIITCEDGQDDGWAIMHREES